MKFSFALSWLPLSLALHIPRTDKPINECSAQSIIDLLKMEPSDEKGFFTQAFIDPETIPGTNRSVSTAIYYLLKGSEGDSLWHKLDAAEVWHYYAGAPLVLSVSWNNGSCGEEHVMGSNLFAGERPQVVVRADEWQRARSLGIGRLLGLRLHQHLFRVGRLLRLKDGSQKVASPRNEEYKGRRQEDWQVISHGNGVGK